MSVDKETVARIANLARIAIDDNKLSPMTDELNNILNWVKQLSEVDTENVAPMTSAVDMKLHWREDVVTDGSIPEDILKNASDSQYGFFAVPKVIE
ncbi:MAG: Asp-tRNA(Asn)/Glu-tRNA(Gln) amidotransferase subunit GatC [Sphingomonadales bacterium]|jgi:aspartyl-tRNA(Asn)/glutamyl-tRNA(Gln) amidotransferase subunit C